MKRLHLLSAHIALEQAEVSLPAKKGLDYNRILDYLLKDYKMYEFVVIDTPGSRVSIFPVMAMTASDTVTCASEDRESGNSRNRRNY